jgi:hypothetical protein
MEEDNTAQDAAGGRGKALVLKTHILKALDALGEGLHEKDPEAVIIKDLRARCLKESREVALYHMLKTMNEILVEAHKLGRDVD